MKCLRKGEKGLVIMAGDISPIDVISHLAVYCEDLEVPYIYVNSKVGARARARALDYHAAARRMTWEPRGARSGRRVAC